MAVFGEYSQYYNLLYKDKDYKAESEYIHQLIRKYKPEALNILEMGCGTCKHAIELTSHGYSIFGIDMSEEMLQQAEETITDKNIKDKISVACSDIRTFETDTRFDVCLSLFHVISYQNSNEDIISAFNTASKHLKADGIFIFDCWYGPAVLTDRPALRKKYLEDDIIEIIRNASPDMHAKENIVDVNYSINIKNKITGDQKTITEKHKMRYLFSPEVELMLNLAGLKLENSFEFLTDHELGYDTWGACFVGRKR